MIYSGVLQSRVSFNFFFGVPASVHSEVLSKFLLGCLIEFLSSQFLAEFLFKYPMGFYPVFRRDYFRGKFSISLV